MKNIQTVSTARVRPVAITSEDSPRVRELMTFGRDRLWDVAVLGQAPMPQEAIRLNNWLIIPAHQDNTEIPDHAMERVQAIFVAGFRPKGFVLVHEAPMMLSAPETNQTQLRTPWTLNPETTEKVINGLSFGVSAIAKLMVGTVTLAVVAGSLILPGLLLAGAVLIDPILIAVTEDNYWIEIDRWLV